MNSEGRMDQFDTHIDPFMGVKRPARLYSTNRKRSADNHVIGHFRKMSLFFRDTRNDQEHDVKTRLSIRVPSSEKPLAEIIRLKKNRPYY